MARPWYGPYLKSVTSITYVPMVNLYLLLVKFRQAPHFCVTHPFKKPAKHDPLTSVRSSTEVIKGGILHVYVRVVVCACSIS